MKKNVPLLILVGFVVIIAGYLGFTAVDQGNTPEGPQQGTVSSAGDKTKLPQNSNSDSNQEVQPEKTKSKVPETDPEQGEIFVEGEIIAVDVEKRILTIDQHMDDNSVTITPNVAIAKDALIQNKEMDISLGEIKVGDVVGMVLTKDRKARAVLVNY